MILTRAKRFNPFALLAAALLAALILPPLLRLYTPEHTVRRLLDALQDGRFAKAESLTVAGLGPDYKSSRRKELYKAIYSTMSYTVTSGGQDGDTAAVTVSITIIDMDELLTAYSGELLADSLAGGGLWPERHYRQLARRIRGGGQPVSTSSVTVALIRTGGGWKVDAENSAELVKAVICGIGDRN